MGCPELPLENHHLLQIVGKSPLLRPFPPKSGMGILPMVFPAQDPPKSGIPPMVFPAPYFEYDPSENIPHPKTHNTTKTYREYANTNTLTWNFQLNDAYPYFEYETEGGVSKIQKPTGTTYFTYNDANLVKSIHYADDTWTYFHYDGMLRRYAIQDDEFGLSYFTWDQNGVNLLAERDEAGTVTARYTHGYAPVEGIGSIVEAERIDSGCSYYQFPVYDHRGTVHKLVDRSGETVGNYVYNAFGEILDQTNPPEGNRFKYQTNWMALKEGLYLSPSRVYSGELGRFLQVDPLPAVRERGKLGIYQNSVFAEEILRKDLVNFWREYAYAGNAPVNGWDFLGLWKQKSSNSNIYIAAKGDSLFSLAKSITGSSKDWACIWPVCVSGSISNYPYNIKKGDRFDVSNLKTRTGGSYAVELGNDNMSPVRKAFYKARSFFSTQDAVDFIKRVSGQGQNPIQELVIAGHGGGNSIGSKYYDNSKISANIILDNESIHTWNQNYSTARKRIGPARCWFTVNAKVWGASCKSKRFSREFAARILRKGAIAYATPSWLTWMPYDGVWTGYINVYWKHYSFDSMKLDPHWIKYMGR